MDRRHGVCSLFSTPRCRSARSASPLTADAHVLGRFFQAVFVASLLTLASGVWMLGRVAKQVVQSGGSFEMPLAWTVMAILGVVMVAIFMHIRFVLFKRLGQAVAASEWTEGGVAMAQIRRWVLFNLGTGVLVLLVSLMRWTN